MNIRPARVDDAHAIAVVHVRSWRAAYRGLVPQGHLDGLDAGERRLRWERILAATARPRAGTLVAEAEQDVIVFVNVGPTRDDGENATGVGEISAIYVLPEAWGQGAGRRLMAAGLDALAAADFGEATLWVLDTNARARRLYEHGCWRTDGNTRRRELRGSALTEVRYRRRLSEPR